MSLDSALALALVAVAAVYLLIRLGVVSALGGRRQSPSCHTCSTARTPGTTPRTPTR